MGEDLRSIIVSAAGIILAGLALRLVDRKWVKESKGVLQGIVPAGATMIMVILMVVFVYLIVWPGPERDWKVAGRVVDKKAQRDIKGAEVTMTIERVLSDETGNDGRFSIGYSEIPISSVRISVKKEDYEPWTGDVPINSYRRIQLESVKSR
ncbi:MAG: hypothetical protein AMJ89_06540 [candidate division Zixibacteria bacterium SM23_73]|nr:MAG: hypothetical protein AMJ89_06540 [candidate division Zixibacteria bacterium SM23_73]